jgi:hypothetical protein
MTATQREKLVEFRDNVTSWFSENVYQGIIFVNTFWNDRLVLLLVALLDPIGDLLVRLFVDPHISRPDEKIYMDLYLKNYIVSGKKLQFYE